MIHEGDNAVLLIGNTYEEDSGTFTCRATTAAGQAETSAKLVVKILARERRRRQAGAAGGAAHTEHVINTRHEPRLFSLYRYDVY
ncbi:jg20424 [Pararge aegeria aegeria]|uniref:Jg20424 protein n=1 Tax=Pararge aegeria aegeria TaxID=348720 RepID=A0A8S4QNG7_9NEOP|nr:jg20424 [Pararge aegeria aegeria]